MINPPSNTKHIFTSNFPSTLPFHQRRLYAALMILVVAGVLFFVAFPASVNVTRTVQRQHLKTPWVWLDYISLPINASPNDVKDSAGTFDGRVRLPDSRVLWIENTSGGEVGFTLNDQEIYRGSDTEARLVLDSSVPAVATFHLDYQWQGTFPAQGHIALMQEGIAGSRTLASPWQFVTDDVPANFEIPHVLRLLFVPLVVVGFALMVFSLRLSRRRWIALVAVLALSLAVHLISLNEKLANDPGVWTMETVWDNYVVMGRGWLAGTVAVGGQLYQQGDFLYLGFVQQVIGPNIAGLYTFNTIIGSFGAVFVLLAGWALFDYPIGILAGVMIALFAPFVHYQHTVQVTAASSLLLCLLLASTAGLYRWRHPVFAIFSGIIVGLAGLFQGTILLLVALPLLALLAHKSSLQTKFTYGVAVAACAALTIIPVTISNFNAGYHVLTANLADYQMFRSNNRDSMGMNTYMTQSEQLAIARGDDKDWVKALQRDLAGDWWRIVELTARRVALFWDSNEHSDSGMTDYITTGVDVSPTLRVLSLAGQANFRILMSLALVGFVLGVRTRERRGVTLLVGAGVLIYIAALAGFYVIGRVRAPIAPLPIMLGAVGIASSYRLLRNHPTWVSVAWVVFAVTGAFGVAWVMDAADNNLPRPEFIDASQLPTDMVSTQGSYNGEIKLLGYNFYDTNAMPNGYLTFELYWQTLSPPSRDYVVTMRFVNTRTQAIDEIYNFTLGAQGAPARTSTFWHPGDIFQERYLIKLPDKSDLQTYNVMVGLYSTEDKQLATLTDANADSQDNHLRLAALSFKDVHAASVVPPSSEPLLVWDNTLVLQALDCETDGQGTTLTLNWFSLRRAVRDQHLFVHLLDDKGDVLAQRDGTPQDNVPVDAWLLDTAHATSWHFDGVKPASVRLGFYDAFSHERWTISASHDLSVQDNYAQFNCNGRVGDSGLG